MNVADLKGKELSNLYAMLKQCNEYFNGSEISFLTDQKQLMLTYYIKHTCGLEEEVTGVLQESGINPGNTKDSVVAEMTENLGEIIKMDIDSDAKEMGYLMSVNRLMAYQIANLENLQFFRDGDETLAPLIAAIDEFKNIQKSIF